MRICEYLANARASSRHIPEDVGALALLRTAVDARALVGAAAGVGRAAASAPRVPLRATTLRGPGSAGSDCGHRKARGDRRRRSSARMVRSIAHWSARRMRSSRTVRTARSGCARCTGVLRWCCRMALISSEPDDAGDCGDSRCARSDPGWCPGDPHRQSTPSAQADRTLHPDGVRAVRRRNSHRARCPRCGRGVDEPRLPGGGGTLWRRGRRGLRGLRAGGRSARPSIARRHRYLHTGRDETFGLSVLEAAWSGVPVVAVDEGGPRDILGDGALGGSYRACLRHSRGQCGRSWNNPITARNAGRQAQASVRARFRWEAGAAALIAAVTQTRDTSGARALDDSRVALVVSVR